MPTSAISSMSYLAAWRSRNSRIPEPAKPTEPGRADVSGTVINARPKADPTAPLGVPFSAPPIPSGLRYCSLFVLIVASRRRGNAGHQLHPE
jgi:hypothetical protein